MKKFSFACVVVVVTVWMGFSVNAAEISWGTAFDIETEADIDVSNEIVRAVNVADPAAVEEIEVEFADGVTVEFEAEHTFEFNVELDEIFGAGGSVTGTSNFYSGQDAGLTTDNFELDDILNSHGWAGAAPGSGVAVLELQDLTVGQGYQIQLIGAADDRGCCEYRQMEIWNEDEEPVTSADGSELWFGRSNDFDQDDERGPGSVIGTFTADADTQQIWLVGTAEFDDGNEGFGNGNDPGLSAYVLSLSGGEAIPGDYNNDGDVNLLDVDLQAVEIKTATPNLEVFDENGDGEVNYDDRKIWVNDHASTWIGDADLNGLFNSSDFVAVFTAGKYESGEMAGWAEGDWDGNMEFTSSDFVAAFGDGGYEQGPKPAAAAVVPEPSSILLLLSSLLGLNFLRRKS